MKLRIAFLTLVTIWAASVTQSSLRAQAAPAGAAKTVWDGVFTDAQAARGEAVYKTACADCHGGDLTGSGDAPALSGAEFTGNWTDLTVGNLFDRMATMPPGNSGSVTAAQRADILGHMLKVNKFPAGQVELDPKGDAMKQIKIVMKP